MHPSVHYLIGIDLGGTKIAAGIVDIRTGEIVARAQCRTEAADGGELVLQRVEGLVQQLKADAGPRDIAGLGIGVPEIVGPDGSIRSGAVIEWLDLPVQERLSVFGPVRIEADVRAAALAEARFGAGKSFSSFAYITIGTGISSTLVVNGRSWSGSRGGALVLASAPLELRSSASGELVSQVLEIYASGPGIARRYREATGQEIFGAEAVVYAAGTGDTRAIRILEQSGEAVGNSIGFLINIVDPEAIVLGGGLGAASGIFRNALEASTRAHIWNEAAQDIPIVSAGFGPESGIVGAALAAFDVITGVQL